MAPRPLGRNKPLTFNHIAAHPLDASSLTSPRPVTVGVDWYTSFDTPKELSDGSFHVPDVEKGEQLGTVRGGHCFCLGPMGLYNTPAKVKYLERLWVFYNQLQ